MRNLDKAEPQGQSYEIACDRALAYASGNKDVAVTSTRIFPQIEGSWNNLYLAGLFRYGLMLTTHQAYMLIYDERYPGGRPITAPRPTDDEPDLWPPDTWIIFRD